VVSSAEQRALQLGEEDVVPRLGDIYAALPAITGKMELEYEGELHGSEKIAGQLIQAAAGLTYEFRAGGTDVDEIVTFFEEGGGLQISPDSSSAACIAGFESVPGLLQTVEMLGLAPVAASPGLRAAACELLLEALVAERRLSRNAQAYRKAPAEGPQGKGYKGFEPFGK